MKRTVSSVLNILVDQANPINREALNETKIINTGVIPVQTTNGNNRHHYEKTGTIATINSYSYKMLHAGKGIWRLSAQKSTIIYNIYSKMLCNSIDRNSGHEQTVANS